MRGLRRHVRALSALAAITGGATLGCEQEPKASSLAAADAGTKPSTVDPALAKAMASVAAPKPGRAPRAGGASGPPPTGVFESVALADKEAPRGGAPNVVLGAEGAEPRVQLTPSLPKPGDKRNARLQLELQTGPRQGLPPLVVNVTMAAQKPPAADAPPGVPMLVTVTDAKVAPSGAAQVPPELNREFAKLKGSRVEYQINESGGGMGFRYQLGKDADPMLDNVLRVVASTLATNAVPLPNKPVGAGAYWMVTSRDELGGMDTIAYRMYKVEGVAGDEVTLSVSTKRYATNPAFEMKGVESASKLTVEQLDYGGDGRIQLKRGAVYPSESQIVERLVAQLIPTDQPTERATVQMQARVSFTPAGGGS